MKTTIPKGPFLSSLLTFDTNCILNVAAFSLSAPMTTSLSSLKGPRLGEILISVERIDIYGTRVRWTSQVAPVVKNLPANAGNARDTGSIPGLGRSPGEGNGNLLEYSCLENPTDREAWRLRSMGLPRVRRESALEQRPKYPLQHLKQAFWPSEL